MDIKVYKGSIDDLQTLVEMRIAYIREDYGRISDEQIEKIKKALPDYYSRHINKDLHIYTAKKDEEIIACGFLLVIEKPASPSFIHGKVGTVLNVYTKPEYRRQGAAKKLLKQMLLEARNMGLDYVELKSTEAGYFLYKSLGFEEVHSKYHNMQLII